LSLFAETEYLLMAAQRIDILRMQFGSGPSITSAITRPNVSFLHTSFGALRLRDSGGRFPSIIFACDAPNVVEHYDAIFSLLSTSYRLICLEMPGFGFSYPSPTFDFSMRQYVDVAALVIERLNSGPVTVMFPCAWSYVAFQLAAERPALIERLIVTQCPCWDEEQAWSKRIDTNGMLRTPVIGQLLLATNQKRIADAWYGAALPKGRAADDFAGPARKVLSNGGIFCLASLMQTWFHVKNPSFLVNQPTVVMWGSSDRTHRHSNPNSVLQYLKSGMVLTSPELGHFPELENPDSFKALLFNDKLWKELKRKQTDPNLEGVSGNDDFSTSDVDDHSSRTVSIKDRRKLLVNHL
jgi:pimeloyl-ACP methyl ester carboxylesterase